MIRYVQTFGHIRCRRWVINVRTIIIVTCEFLFSLFLRVNFQKQNRIMEDPQSPSKSKKWSGLTWRCKVCMKILQVLGHNWLDVILFSGWMQVLSSYIVCLAVRSFAVFQIKLRYVNDNISMAKMFLHKLWNEKVLRFSFLKNHVHYN